MQEKTSEPAGKCAGLSPFFRPFSGLSLQKATRRGAAGGFRLSKKSVTVKIGSHFNGFLFSVF